MSIKIHGSGPRDGLPDYVVTNFSREKTGILTGTVIRHFKIGQANQRLKALWTAISSAPDPGWGIPCVAAPGTIRDGLFIVEYRYEGIETEYSFEDANVIVQWEPTESEESIEMG